MDNILFLSYNKDSDIGQHSALRLQTIAGLYGFSVVLPLRRANSTALNQETKTRIDSANMVAIFALEGVSKGVNEEIVYASQKNKPVIVLFQKGFPQGRIPKDDNIRAVEVDFNSIDKASHEVAEFLKDQFPGRTKKAKETSGSGSALILLGLGLLAAWAITKDK